VDTPVGVVSLSGTGAGRGTLWLAPPGEPPVRIAEGASGFAVSTDGLRLAYSVPDAPGTQSVLRELDLRNRSSIHEKTYSCFASVRAYAVNAVMLDTCDGATGSAAAWLPSRGTVRPVDGYGHVLAADPARNHFLLAEGDGTCARSASLGVNETAHVGTLDIGCEVRSLSSFDPSGRWVALATGDFYEPSISFLDLDPPGAGPGKVLADRVVATAWIPASPDTNDPRHSDYVLFLVTVAEPSRPRLLRCDPVEGQCTVIQVLDEVPNALLAIRGE
jgi:hypothetical protein